MSATPHSPLYFDYNATAPILPSVIEKMLAVMSEGGNASAVYALGRTARRHVDQAREAVAALVGAAPNNVIFTGCGTEANNLALRGLGQRHLIVSAIEHGAVLAPAVMYDARANMVSVDRDGVLDLAALEAALQASTAPTTVSVMLANNETGVLQDIPAIADIVHKYGARLHCDAIQAVGKLPVQLPSLKADMITLSAHKFGGPQGVGALILAEDLPIEAQIIGGGQEMGRRSGTENVAGIAGFGVAVAEVPARIAAYREIAPLRDRLEKTLQAISNRVEICAQSAQRLPNTSNITMPGVEAATQIMAFDLEQIAVSAGSACSSGKVAASHVLQAMAWDPDTAKTAIRISLGPDHTESDIDRFVTVWRRLYDRRAQQPNAA